MLRWKGGSVGERPPPPRVIRTGDSRVESVGITLSGDDSRFLGQLDGLRCRFAPSFANTRAACVLTVFSLTNSWSAISLLLRPAATASRDLQLARRQLAHRARWLERSARGDRHPHLVGHGTSTCTSTGTSTRTGTSRTTSVSRVRVSLRPSQIPTTANSAATMPP